MDSAPHSAEGQADPLVALVDAQVRRTPDAPAVVFGERVTTYRQLAAAADRLARRLRAEGVGPEAVVAVLLGRSDLLVTALLATFEVGATYLPIDPDLPRQRVAQLVDDAGPTVVLTTNRLADLLPRGLRVLPVTADREEDGAPCADTRAAQPRRPVTPDTGRYLIYTSGSTGSPKGVLMPGRSLANLVTWHVRHLPAGPAEVIAQLTTPGFDVSLQEMFSALVTGACLAVPTDAVRMDPARLVAWLEHRGVTQLFASNAVFAGVARAAQEQRRALPALRDIVLGGDAMELTEDLVALFRALPERRLHNHYGPTETHVVTAHSLPARWQDWSEPLPIGTPIWHTAVHLLDARLNPVPQGEVGELHLAGDCVARGYLRRPAQTAERFVPDPFGSSGARMYATGDLGRRLPDGSVEYLGRADHQVKVRGVRVDLGEVETALRRLPGVASAVVAATGDGSRRRLDAYLVPAPGARVGPEQARAALARVLPAAVVPSSFTVLDALPLTPSGKVDRLALPRPDRAAAGHPSAPGTAQEQALCRIVAAVLGAEHVGPEDSFYDLGGHSLLAAEVVAHVRRELGVDLSVADVLRHPTISGLAARLTAGGHRPPLRRRPRPDPLPASYAQRLLWVHDRLEGPSARYNEVLVLRLSGRLDRAALRAAVGDVLARHESLRTVLPMIDGEPCQQILPPDRFTVPFEEVRWSGEGPEDLASLVSAVASTPFALSDQPPVRVCLAQLHDDGYVLAVVMHHVVCDAASLGPLARDLAAAYNARVSGNTPALAPMQFQYADYGLWQRELLGPPGSPTPLARRDAAFWAGTLAGMPEVTPLPTDRPRDPVRGAAGRQLPFEISAHLHARLGALGRSHEATVFMVVHAALITVVRARGGGDDVAIGAVVSDRADGRLADLVGFFVNTVVLRVDASGDPSLGQLIERARDSDRAALAHSALPFDRVVEIVNPARTLSHHPLVQVVLAFQGTETPAAQFTGLHSALERVDTGVAKFDLCLMATERFGQHRAPDGLVGCLEYATDIYDRSTAQAIVEDLVHVLASAVADDAGSVITR